LSTEVQVIDGGHVRRGRLTDRDGALRFEDAPTTVAGDLYVGPGWADMHVHVYDGVTQIGIAPDRAGVDAGIHVIGDAGSAGEGTVRGLIEYVLPTSRTEVRIWLNIGSHGLVHLRETASPEFMDVDATLAAVRDHRASICGIKVRSSGLIVGSMGLTPLELGRRVAREAGLPLMVHIGEAPPQIDDVLDRLDGGDVVTHCFHGKPGYPWNSDGTPAPALARALDRGVLLDVGHGAASFDLGVAGRAIAAGIFPHSISTDLHVRSIDGPAYSLASVMSKMLALGMPLPEIVRAVTRTPRSIMGVDHPWLAEDGTVRHATLFRLADQRIVPVAIVVDGCRIEVMP
jgi:dihydroorotase